MSAAGITTDITSTTGIALIGPAPGFLSLCAVPVVPAGKNLRRDDGYRTKPENKCGTNSCDTGGRGDCENDKNQWP